MTNYGNVGHRKNVFTGKFFEKLMNGVDLPAVKGNDNIAFFDLRTGTW